MYILEDLMSLKTTIFLIVSASFAFILHAWIKRRKKQLSLFEHLGIPFVKPHLITGSMHLLRANLGEGQLELIDKWTKEHGKVFGYYVGWRPTLVVADLDMIKVILVKDFHNFCNRPALVIAAQPVVDTLVGLRDQRWKEVRSILIPTFSMAKMKTIIGILDRKVDTMLNIVREKSSLNEPIEWYTTYQGLTLDSISECALAMKTNCQKEQNEDFLLRSVRQFLLSAINPAILLALYFPFFAYLLGFVSNYLSMSGRLTKAIVSNLKKVIELRRRDLGQRNVDLLQLMLESGEKTHRNNENGSKVSIKNKTLSDEEIIANAWVFLLGGFETTASCLTYTTYLLAKHPNIQENLYEEIQTVTKELEEGFSYEAISKMSYLEQILNESLRLYPPIVSFITREAKEDTQIKDVLIPKGMTVSIPVWQIHRDPEIWEDPEKFDPERFSPSNKKDRHPMAYIPFGAGPRNCIGMRFAVLEAKLALARIVCSYRLECCDETPQELKFIIPTVAINPKEKVLIKAIPRSQETNISS